MRKNWNQICSLAVATVLLPALVYGSQIAVPNQFVNGDVADADAINDNFTALQDAVNDNDARIAGLQAQLDALPPIPLKSWLGTRILAVAYVNQDGEPGFSSKDVLISTLVDTNGDGAPSVGDTIHLGRYPIDFTPSALGMFRGTPHLVANVHEASSVRIIVNTGAGDGLSTPPYFHWAKDPDDERYREVSDSGGDAHFIDFRLGSLSDRIDVTTGSNGLGDVATGTLLQVDSTDGIFLNVDILLP